MTSHGSGYLNSPALRFFIGTALLSGALLFLSPAVAQVPNAPLASPPSSAPASAGYAPYESLRWKGLEVELPGPADSIDGQASGLRASLAAYGIGYLGVSLQNYSENTLDVARTTSGRQLYSGQRPTYFSQNLLLVTYDTGHLGLHDGQIVVGGSRSYYTWLQGGPDKLGLLTLSYYQPFFDHKVELKVGYLVNSFEFANPYIGGALASGVFGQSGSLLYQGGFNGGGVTSPGVEVTLNVTPSVYTKVGVERPISPDGTIVDARQNGSSLDIRVPNTGVLVIDETGYKVAAAPGRSELWVRAAVAANSSRYLDYTARPGSRSAGENGFGYLLADYQLWQAAPDHRPSRGVFIGGSAYFAPPDLNRFSQLYQGRLYTKGLFDARPSDQISFVVSYNVFSKALYQQAIAAGFLAHGDSLALTASYGLHLSPGAYLNLGLTYVDHPTSITYTPRTGSALNALINLSLFF